MFPSALYPFERAVLDLTRVENPRIPSLSDQQWELTLQVLRRERLEAVAAAAAAGARTPVPRTVRETLAAAAEDSRQSVRLRYLQLEAVAGAMVGAGISFLLLKGPALARFVYGQEEWRPFSDLDLLINVDDVDRTHAVLTALGYAIAGGAPSDADRTWRHGRAYADPTRGRVPVDVHWRYAGYPFLMPFNYGALLARSRAVSVDGRPARVPAGADMVQALAIHFLRDLWYGKTRLRYLRDLAEVCVRERVDWDEVRRAAATPGLRAPLALALTLSATLLAAPVPQPVLAAVQPPRPWLMRWLLNRAGRSVMRANRPLATVLQVGLLRAADGGLGELVRWLWSLVAVPSPLAPSQRRWLRYLRGAPFTGVRPAD